jgi:hypothetical protein
MTLHPAWVKNISRRVLWAALEADLTKHERQMMADYFSAKCACCEDALPRRCRGERLLTGSVLADEVRTTT